MTVKKVREVLALYAKKFEDLGVSKGKVSHDVLPAADKDCLSHCYGMLDQMEVFLEEGDMDKVCRWLGFIQGCMWVLRIYPLIAFRNHNRS